MRKIIILEKSRQSLDNKHKIEVKNLLNKISLLEEQIKYLNLKNKESESKLKITNHQINEYKFNNKNITKKINKVQENYSNLLTYVKEKEDKTKKFFSLEESSIFKDTTKIENEITDINKE